MGNAIHLLGNKSKLMHSHLIILQSVIRNMTLVHPLFFLHILSQKDLQRQIALTGIQFSFSRGEAFKQLATVIQIWRTLGRVWELYQPLAHQLCLQYLWELNLPVKEKKDDKESANLLIVLIAAFTINQISGSHS